MSWQILILISIIFFNISNLLQKVVGTRIHPIYYLPIFSICVFVLSLVFLGLSKILNWNNLSLSPGAITPLIVASIFWTIAQMSFFIMISGKTSFSVIMTVFTVSAAVLSYITGIIFFKDAVRPINIFGLLVALVGLIFLSL